MNNSAKEFNPRSAFLRFFAITLIVCAFLTAYAFSVYKPKKADAAAHSGAVVIEASTGRVLYSDNMNVRTYPASTTKILTALVTLESIPLDTVITVPDCAAGVEGSSIYLRKGEKLTIGELLYGLMLRSGNDAAVALAVSVAGSIEKFADMMNDRAVRCGAVNSNFVNPHGLHDDNHYTTAYDLALITAEAYKNADFRRIVATKSVTINGAEGKRYLSNKNKLLTTFDGANGVKTGYTTKSGRCLVGGAERDGMQLISVVLNRYDMWEATKKLLEDAFATYEMRELPVLPFPDENAGNLRVDVKVGDDGELTPSFYPVKKDGSEIPYAVYGG